MAGRRKHPTDEGWAWVVLVASLGSHCLNGALVYSVGVLHTGLLHTFRSDSVTMVAMTGAVNTGLVCIAAPLAGYIINRFGCRTCCVLGGLLCFVGYTSSSFVTSVILLFFTFGIITGTGLGLTYSATNITIGFYFDRLRGVASGISNSFQAVGILSGSVIFQALIETYSVHGTFLLLGAASLHFCFFGMFFRPSIYEGNTMEIMVEEQQENQDIEMQISHPDKTAEVLKFADIEEESQSLLEKNRQGQTDLHEDVTTGPSHDPDTTDDIGANDINTDDAITETVNSADVTLTTEASKDLSSTMQHFVSEKNSDTCEAVQVDETSPVVETSDDPSQHQNQKQACSKFSKVSDLLDSKDSHSNRPEKINNSTCSPDVITKSNFSRSVPENLPPPHDKYQQHRSHKDDLTTEAAASHEHECLVVSNSDPIKDEQDRKWAREQGQERQWGCCGSYIKLLSSPAFMLHCASLFVSNVHIGGVFLHLPEYVQHHATSTAKAAQLFLVVGCMSLVSKLSGGFALADPNIDPLILSIGMMGLNGIFTCLFPLYVDTYVKQMVFSTLFGLYFGGLYALINPILVRFAGVSRLADAYGISMFILGLGYLMGPTLAAMIVDAGGTYGHSFLFLGLMMLSGAFLDMGAACFLQSREKMQKARENADWSEEDKGVVRTCQSQEEEANHEKDTEVLSEDFRDCKTSQSQALSIS